jgi:hypothetical protein
LAHPEAVLLINNDKPKIVVFEVGTEQLVSTDQDVDVAG